MWGCREKIFATLGGWSGQTLWRRRQSSINVKQVRGKAWLLSGEKHSSPREERPWVGLAPEMCSDEKAATVAEQRMRGGEQQQRAEPGGRREEGRPQRPEGHSRRRALTFTSRESEESACNAGVTAQISESGKAPLEGGIATSPSILTWRIPWTEEPGGLLLTGSQNWA